MPAPAAPAVVSDSDAPGEVFRPGVSGQEAPMLEHHPGALKIWIDGVLCPRAEARVSVFDASFQSGDGVWEGIRVYDGRVFELDAHVDRLFDSARALDIALHLRPSEIKEALFATLRANNLRNDTHVRLMVSRGERRTSGMNPDNVASHPTIVIVAERKPPGSHPQGIRLVTSSVRRPSPDTLDPRIHHCNQLNSILAKIEANHAGVDGAVMLDQRGFVAETDSMNLFVVKAGGIATPNATACLHGITRGLVIREARRAEFEVSERDISLGEVHAADEVFTTGTIAEIVPVAEVDHRQVSGGRPGPVTARMAELYAALTSTQGAPIPDSPIRPAHSRSHDGGATR